MNNNLTILKKMARLVKDSDRTRTIAMLPDCAAPQKDACVASLFVTISCKLAKCVGTMHSDTSVRARSIPNRYKSPQIRVQRGCVSSQKQCTTQRPRLVQYSCREDKNHTATATTQMHFIRFESGF